MRFKISDISKMTGISPSGIRFYENAGVISPGRAKNQKYRDYSLHELHLLLLCKIYRDSGFSLSESINLLYCSETEQIKHCCEQHYARLSDEINRKQILLETLGQRIKDIIDFQKDPPFYRFMQSPALLRMKVWQPGKNAKDDALFSQVQEWLKFIPFVESCLILSRDNLCNGKGDLETDWGLAIEERHALLLNVPTLPNVERIPPQDCLRVVIEINKDLSIPSEQLNSIRKFMAEKEVEAAGPAVSRLFLAQNHRDHIVRRDMLWIPIQKTGSSTVKTSGLSQS